MLGDGRRFWFNGVGAVHLYVGAPPRRTKGEPISLYAIEEPLRALAAMSTSADQAALIEIHRALGYRLPEPPRREELARMADEIVEAIARGHLVALKEAPPAPPPRVERAPELRELEMAPATMRDPEPQRTTTWIGLVLVDGEGEPVPRRAYSLVLPDGSARDGFFDERGRRHLEGLDPGTCAITFTDLDDTDFREPLPMDGGQSDGKGPVEADATGLIHIVETGETLASIAERRGFLHASTIWNRPENAELRRRRESPFVLLEGDAVFVPKKTAHQASCATTRENTFVVYREKTQVRLRARTRADHAVPLDPGTASVDGASIDATVAGDVLVTPVPRDSRALAVVATDGQLELALGELGPIREERGVLMRLDNLGVLPEEALASGDEGDDLEDAERLELGCELFQESVRKKPTGNVDDDTIDALRDRAGA